MHPVLLRVSLDSPGLSLALLVAIVALLAATGSVLAASSRRRGSIAAFCCLALGGALAFSLRARSVSFGGFELTSFGTCLFIGLGSAGWLGLRSAARQGVDRDASLRALVLAALAGFVGGRVGYVALNAAAFSSVWDVLSVGTGGLSLAGGLGFALIATLWVLVRSRVPPMLWGDVVIVPLLWLGTWGAAGSYLAGAEQGRLLGEAAPDWLARLGTFPRWEPGLIAGLDGPPVLLEQVARGVVPFGSPRSAAVHPTQLYELGALALLLGVVVRASRRRRWQGETLLLGALGYALVHLVVGILRGDVDRGLLPVELSQPGLLVGLVLPVVLALGYVALSVRAEPPRAIAWAALALGLPPLSYVAGRGALVVSPSVMQVVSVLVVLVSAAALGRHRPRAT